jgi:hypothetical protein
MRAHIRSVKPEALTDEALWDLEQETGLPLFRAFVGLWTQADREGRFEWRPRPLKAAVLPYWDGDFSRVLDALATRGFLVKYVVDGREYGWVRTFHKHQLINNREAASVLPPPPKAAVKNANNTAELAAREPRVNDASTTGEGNARGDLIRSEGIGSEGSGSDASATREPRAPEVEPTTFREQHPTAPAALLADRLAEHLAIAAMLPRWEVSGPERIVALAWIADQPLTELRLAIAALLADPWVRQQPHRATPEHIRRQWPKYAAGPQKPTTGSGPAAVSTDDEWAAAVAAQEARQA